MGDRRVAGERSAPVVTVHYGVTRGSATPVAVVNVHWPDGIRDYESHSRLQALHSRLQALLAQEGTEHHRSPRTSLELVGESAVRPARPAAPRREWQRGRRQPRAVTLSEDDGSYGLERDKPLLYPASVEFIALAAASGLVGNSAYAALRTAVRLAFERLHDESEDSDYPKPELAEISDDAELAAVRQALRDYRP